MKRASSFISVIVFCLCAAGSVSAAPTGELRVGFVDLQAALSATKAGALAKDSYEAEVKAAQANLDSKKKELSRQKAEFTKQRDSLSDEAKLSKEEKLMSLEKDLRRSFKDTEEQLRRKNGRLVGGLLKKMRTVVDEVGKEEGFSLILEKGSQAVLYADTSIDVTDKVITKFNERN